MDDLLLIEAPLKTVKMKSKAVSGRLEMSFLLMTEVALVSNLNLSDRVFQEVKTVFQSLQVYIDQCRLFINHSRL